MAPKRCNLWFKSKQFKTKDKQILHGVRHSPPSSNTSSPDGSPKLQKSPTGSPKLPRALDAAAPPETGDSQIPMATTTIKPQNLRCLCCTRCLRPFHRLGRRQIKTPACPAVGVADDPTNSSMCSRFPSPTGTATNAEAPYSCHKPSTMIISGPSEPASATASGPVGKLDLTLTETIDDRYQKEGSERTEDGVNRCLEPRKCDLDSATPCHNRVHTGEPFSAALTCEKPTQSQSFQPLSSIQVHFPRASLLKGDQAIESTSSDGGRGVYPGRLDTELGTYRVAATEADTHASITYGHGFDKTAGHTNKQGETVFISAKVHCPQSKSDTPFSQTRDFSVLPHCTYATNANPTATVQIPCTPSSSSSTVTPVPTSVAPFHPNGQPVGVEKGPRLGVVETNKPESCPLGATPISSFASLSPSIPPSTPIRADVPIVSDRTGCNDAVTTHTTAKIATTNTTHSVNSTQSTFILTSDHYDHLTRNKLVPTNSERFAPSTVDKPAPLVNKRRRRLRKRLRNWLYGLLSPCGCARRRAGSESPPFTAHSQPFPLPRERARSRARISGKPRRTCCSPCCLGCCTCCCRGYSGSTESFATVQTNVRNSRYILSPQTTDKSAEYKEHEVAAGDVEEYWYGSRSPATLVRELHETICSVEVIQPQKSPKHLVEASKANLTSLVTEQEANSRLKSEELNNQFTLQAATTPAYSGGHQIEQKESEEYTKTKIYPYTRPGCTTALLLASDGLSDTEKSWLSEAVNRPEEVLVQRQAKRILLPESDSLCSDEQNGEEESFKELEPDEPDAIHLTKINLPELVVLEGTEVVTFSSVDSLASWQAKELQCDGKKTNFYSQIEQEDEEESDFVSMQSSSSVDLEEAGALVSQVETLTKESQLEASHEETVSDDVFGTFSEVDESVRRAVISDACCVVALAREEAALICQSRHTVFASLLANGTVPHATEVIANTADCEASKLASVLVTDLDKVSSCGVTSTSSIAGSVDTQMNMQLIESVDAASEPEYISLGSTEVQVGGITSQNF
ncbi:unnamed protein product [Protopolystoma xenopodis]|uniref:Uncharacterized protein n=1 Tax=Protopolystoma xenopodis TaxID=117903 RepID=A0A3S5B0J6_9PLAT|nr:unnamed protein product [Protopolystoma xenopodis]